LVFFLNPLADLPRAAADVGPELRPEAAGINIEVGWRSLDNKIFDDNLNNF
jgi:hypothetical protein